MSETIEDSRPGWRTWREAIAVVREPEHLQKTIAIAIVIGTVFVVLNQLGLILSGRADAVVWAKAVMTYLTPLCVSNYSILVATRARGRGPGKGGTAAKEDQ